jgi:hypothetical protein
MATVPVARIYKLTGKVMPMTRCESVGGMAAMYVCSFQPVSTRTHEFPLSVSVGGTGGYHA